jgi:amino acid transporter
VRPRPGNSYVRIVRRFSRQFHRQAPGYLVATERALAPRGSIGRLAERARSIFIGRRLASHLEGSERVGVFKGLALFASDNISSSAYATEEVMRMLVLAGAAALSLTMPITVAIVVVLAIVVLSYQQVIRAYPGGGGSYVVARENLGDIAGLTAVAALTTDYILTVAVSTAAGIAAITSIAPELFAQRVILAVLVITVMTIVNLRGITESGNVFAAPAYIYAASILGVIVVGMFRAASGTLPVHAPPAEWVAAYPQEPLALILVLRAFASGSVALTGTEAVADGVQAFKPPEVKNSQTVLVAMGGLFATIFLGMSFLAGHLGILPDPSETETLVSQLTRALVGQNPYYYLVQVSTAVLLLLAANTAFNGFPRLANVVARDRYLPRQFQFRGDRLAFTVGILLLSVVSIMLVVAFEGSVSRLIPLYTVGVFLAFTLSQAGLVGRWWRMRREVPGWQWRIGANTAGALATGVVLIVVAVSKFALGAWMVLLLIPLLVLLMYAIQIHYNEVEDALTLERPDAPGEPPVHAKVIVPVSRLDRTVVRALAVARSISDDVTAIHIGDDPQEADHMRQLWAARGEGLPLVFVESPYRALIPPLLAYLDAVDTHDRQHPIVVVLPEFVPRHFWEYVLHNQTAMRLKLRLFLRPNTMVIDVPYHLGDPTIQSSPVQTSEATSR